MQRRLLLFALTSLLCAQVVSQGLNAQDATKQAEFFENSIRPLLADQCWSCHGPDKQWNGLRLDSEKALLIGGDLGPSITVGKASQSLLIQAVERKGDLQMPPDNPLTAQQIDLLRKWIDMGAPWPKSETAGSRDAWKSHWAFQPISTIQPPKHPEDTWSRNEIDAFVFQSLKDNGLQPSREADRETLIRRASYSLLGIPPTYEEMDAFVRDTTAEAYERMIDRLLESPRYGEHLGRMWLDVARYADTKGYVYGREERFFVNASLYRDWVIKSFNDNLPYDHFIKLQIAADQCASDDPPALAAMGLLTLGRRFLGVTHDIIDDRIDVVGRGTMGLTIACARCHDHKYDPIPTADYYSLYGVFQCSTDRQVDLRKHASSQASAEFTAELQKREQALKDTTAAKRLETGNRVRSRTADYLFAQTELNKYGQEGFDIIIAVDDIIPAFVRRWEGFLSQRTVDDPVFGPWHQFNAIESDFALQSAATVSRLRQSSTAHPWVMSLFDNPPQNMRAVADRYGELLNKVDARWKELSGVDTASRSASDQQWIADAKQLVDVLYGPAAPCEVPDEEIIATETYFDSGTCNELWKLQGEVDRWRLQGNDAPQVAVAVYDRATLVDPRVFRRGNPANKGPRVSRHFLTLFSTEPPQPFSHGSGRLELANRIVEPTNPLTSRVWVNRLWQHHFGQGLVQTASDFGLRASPPSHPELLDWLASELIRSQWNTKAIQRKMLLSATFRQASGLGANINQSGNMQQDPENRLLWRMNSRRLRFEEIRDSLLQSSGDLKHQLGGKPSEIFSSEDANHRRTVYGLVDRQFLPSTLRVFDFANPDLHIGKRSETLVPQQSLYFLNDPFIAHRAKSLASKLSTSASNSALSNREQTEQISALYRAVLKRNPTAAERENSLRFLQQPDEIITDAPPETAKDWSYGFGEVDEPAGRLKSFNALPHFTGSAWQGGTAFPDPKYGWAQVSAHGGHPGNDLAHACVRRWTAPKAMTVTIQSTAKHEPNVSDGARFRILSSRHGLLATQSLKSSQAEMNVQNLELQAGDTIDFVVDIIQELNSDQFLWAPMIQQVAVSDPAQKNTQTWNAIVDFHGPIKPKLTRQEQLAQVLMLTNEFWFVD
jgi:Protein of unknown function (DUF1553)/Protein of unknown function (DUF1549)/Planctomycete cytochrome C